LGKKIFLWNFNMLGVLKVVYMIKQQHIKIL